jgi:acetyl-CoA carboxylase carboxyl transferase subunit beta
VIEQTIREKLPEGFQRAEYLQEHGMVDMVVPRNQLRPTLSNICRLLTKEPIAPPAPVPAIAMLPQSDDVTSPPNA